METSRNLMRRTTVINTNATNTDHSVATNKRASARLQQLLSLLHFFIKANRLLGKCRLPSKNPIENSKYFYS